jgi:serine phosphatase RsbU (regulator of sigma subunit)
LRPQGSYWLIGLEGNARRVKLAADGPLLVGRGVHNHLVLNDYRISRQHARVAHERDGFVVYDLNSANGTFVNGSAVRRQVLNAEDQVSFGPWAFRLEFHAEAAATADPAAGVKWRPTESITLYNQSAAAMKEAAAASRMATRDTIPPEGDGSLPLSTDYDIPVSIRESTRYVAETSTIDLNHLEDAYEKLGTLYAFMQAISKTIDLHELLALITERVLDHYPAARGVGIYMGSKGNRPSHTANEAHQRFQLVHFAGAEAPKAPAVLADGIGQALLRSRQATFGDSPAHSTKSGTSMYAPMIDRADVLGVIYVAGANGTEAFTLGDLELLNGMAAPAAMMLQNTRMHEESLQRERLNRDLELAAQIQKSFLPREVLSVPGFEFLATYKAAYVVGGDFYDVFWVGNNQLAVFVGDISGKGVAAALLMARISGELRVAALAHVDPVEVLSMMNKAVLGRGQPEFFFTAIYFTINVKTGEVRLATAGHPPPYICHADGLVEAISEGASVAVGMMEDPAFTETGFVLANGDSLVLYTDGVIEASDANGQLYGDSRLEACLATAGPRPADISSNILESVYGHTQMAAANDDLTIFVCHRRDGAAFSLQPRRISDTTLQPLRIPNLRPPTIK